jgi:hypothetical protein
MDEITKAVLDALKQLGAAVERIDEAGSETYGVEHDGERFFVTIEQV